MPGAEWAVAPPADEGVDPGQLAEARSYAFGPGRNTQGVVVVRHGKIVAEWYAPGADEDSYAASWSVGKSFASALVGIAIEQGKIPSVDEPMTTYFPQWKGTDKAAMTLRNVMQMESGLAWNEDYGPAGAADSQVAQMIVNHPDELAYVADQPLAEKPGTRWSYSSGDAMLLSAVIGRATGMSAEAYAEQVLFGPIGIDQVDWWQDAKGHTLTFCCLDTTSRDFARFGLLYLHDGRWGDRQVVPSAWVHDSIQNAPGASGYGYMWWLGPPSGAPKDTYAAIGHDGQYIYVIPSLDLVVVRNGTYVKDPGPPIADPNLFSKYPPDGLVKGKGTLAPNDWDDSTFLTAIVKAVTG